MEKYVPILGLIQEATIGLLLDHASSNLGFFSTFHDPQQSFNILTHIFYLLVQ
jgi:hypothetical protein